VKKERALKRISVLCLCAVVVAFTSSVSAAAAFALTADVLMEKMIAAYDQVSEYQTKTEVRNLKADGSAKVEAFLYSFRKPLHIRLDLETPHPGTTIVYPDRGGKAVVRPSGVLGFFSFRLSPGSSLFDGPNKQSIDQTDLGLLIRNIGHSLTDQRRGPVGISEEGNFVRVKVLAVDHFRPDTVTLYEILVDTRAWLPARVAESTADGRLLRVVTFGGLRINPGLPDTFFDTDGQKVGTERRNGK
jgi:outer membrane lipoprotein-sorting protein